MFPWLGRRPASFQPHAHVSQRLSLPSLRPGLPPNCVQSMERARSAPPPEEVVVHIAEKFRLAWESRETRLREIAEKQSKNEARRKMRMISAAERAIYTWEDSL